jgi:hypothetical protein
MPMGVIDKPVLLSVLKKIERRARPDRDGSASEAAGSPLSK